MPDMQPMQGQEQAPPQGQPEGGGMVEALSAMADQLSGLVDAISKSQVPDPVKQGFFQANQAFQSAMEGLVKAAKGEAAAEGEPGGQETMEQGGNPRAVPVGG